MSATIITVAGNGIGAYNRDHIAATKAELSEPSAVRFDSKGNLYIIDDFNERVRMVNTKHIITTIAGNGTTGDSGDGGPATNAEFQFGDGGGVAVDSKGDIFIADPDKARVREILPNGIIEPFAGSSENPGYTGDGGPATAALLGAPFAVAVDKNGDVFIADGLNNDIREVTPDGIIHTVAGNQNNGFSGDGGPATAAELSSPSDVAVDNNGNLFILDSGNNRVREVTTNGDIKTVAGNGQTGFSGDGGSALDASFNFDLEGGLAVDNKGDIFIADSGNNRIREVTANGKIKTIAGDGVEGYGGDHHAAKKAKLDNPTGVAVNAKGDVFFADTGNNRVREIVV